MVILPKPGDVVIIYHSGVQTSKYRPNVVVSSDMYHATRPDVILATITTRIPAVPEPLDYVLLDWQAAGLHYASMFRPFLSSMPVADVPLPVGRLSDRDWAEVQARLRLAMAI
jgi:mRNA interferase MazF